jgi:hypothetical protein
MASAKVRLRDPGDGLVKEAPLGFSWTTLFFGFLTALLRNDRNWAFLQLLLMPTVIPWFIFPFIYNKLYLRSLLGAGYIPVDEEAKELLATRGFAVSDS